MIINRRRSPWIGRVLRRRRAVDIEATKLGVDVCVGNVLSIRLMGSTFWSLIEDVGAACACEPTSDERGSGRRIVAPKDGDRGEGTGNQQGSDVYLECYVPEDGPDKETGAKYANKWGALIFLMLLI